MVPCRRVDIKCQSQEDWTAAITTARCHPNFHGHPRQDCVMLNTSPSPTYAHLAYIFTCVFPSGTHCDLALVHAMDSDSWRPRTVWEGCQVFKQSPRTSLVMAQYLMRAVRMIPTFHGAGDRYYLDDLLDGDAVVRFDV